ncbi:phage minor head protein [Ottowia pentelensis]|uniref:Phage minor head protein n=1 Tax=Ottowia pentelensis TaxID=511108 RepID=A0ABV6PW63_9BURK
MAKPDRDALRALFDLAPEAAIEYLRSKGLRITFKWQEMLDEAHARSFTVAKAMRLDVLQDIRTALLGALKEGKTFLQFEKELTPLLQSKGWWGKQIVVDGDGQAQQVQLGSLRRLKTIYQTNLQSAYMAGRAQAIAQTSNAFPYMMYVAVMDSRTRPSHAALNGKIWRKDDPIWQVIFPPNGFNCRCRTRPLTEGMMKREGLEPSPPPEVLTRAVNAGSDPLTGELFPTVQTGVRVADANGKPITMWVDAGFNSSPLAGHAFDELLARKAVAALGDTAGFELVREAVLSPSRMKAWDAFIDGTLDSGVRNRAGEPAIQGQTMTVGMLPLDAAREMAARGSPVFPVLHAEDRLIIGRKARRHEAIGDALTEDQWRALPIMLKDATFYRQLDGGNVVAIMDAGKPGEVIKVVFAPDGRMDTAFVVSADSIEGSVKGGLWELLGGRRGT